MGTELEWEVGKESANISVVGPEMVRRLEML